MFQTADRPRAFILSRPLVVAALAVGFALIFATALLNAYSVRGLAAADQRTAQTQHALIAATQFVAALADAAATVDERAANETHLLARERARADLATLARSFASEPALQPLVAQLQQLTNRYFARLDDATLANAADTPRAAATIRDLVATLQRNRFGALAESSALAADRAERIEAINLGLLLLGGSLAVAISLWLLLRLRDLEGLITVCAWTRRVQWQGKWLSFEEYLAKRFNIYCSHGICEEAAEKMKQEAANTPIEPDLLR